MSHHFEAVAWLAEYLAPLQGARIVATAVNVEDGEAWPVLQVKLSDGTELVLEISRDEEGNGPGFIHGLPTVPAVIPGGVPGNLHDHEEEVDE